MTENSQNSPGLLTYKEFDGLTKQTLYKIYCDLYQQKEDYRQFTTLLTEMKGKMSSLSPVQGESDNKGTPGSETCHYETNTNPNNRKHVSKRPFSPFELNADTRNLVIGSSICARIKPWLIPQDTQLHAYRGSTTSDKLKVLQQYKTEGRTFNCIILQDGTNSILKNRDKDTNELFEKYSELVTYIIDNFEPQQLVLCEVPPVLNDVAASKKIEEFNMMLNEQFKNEDNIAILKLNEIICGVQDWTKMYWDNIHLNDSFGIPFLTNNILTFVNQYSNKLPRQMTQKQSVRSKYYPASYKSSKYMLHTNPLSKRFDHPYHQSYNYMSGY